ncbi:hypothetical protein [Thalassotalea agarivorans]|uniref:Uncharacterized protein n=1 Tax=Thalassotalea agarivorans TaxID=349064 RepID=A0A1H9YMR1_THASX|nr:hypothetical protein [Thalassotalea agarivorans]SES69903.1 hypothetical protein SAMN05660429_00268 [Thalassotalea agarivorans]
MIFSKQTTFFKRHAMHQLEKNVKRAEKAKHLMDSRHGVPSLIQHR